MWTLCREKNGVSLNNTLLTSLCTKIFFFFPVHLCYIYKPQVLKLKISLKYVEKFPVFMWNQENANLKQNSDNIREDERVSLMYLIERLLILNRAQGIFLNVGVPRVRGTKVKK